MPKVQVDIDYASHYGDWSVLRKDPAVQAWLEAAGARIAAQASANAAAYGAHHRDPTDDSTFWVSGRDVGSRYAVYVGTSSAEARVAEQLHGALRDSLHAGAGE